jgi:hypothetical protein
MRDFRSFIVLPALLFSFLTVAGSESIADDDLFVDFQQVDSAIRIQVTNKSKNTIYLHEELLPFSFIYRDENTESLLGLSAQGYSLPTHQSEKNIVTVDSGKSYTAVMPLPVDLANDGSIVSFSIHYSRIKAGYLKGDWESIRTPFAKEEEKEKSERNGEQNKFHNGNAQ